MAAPVIDGGIGVEWTIEDDTVKFPSGIIVLVHLCYIPLTSAKIFSSFQSRRRVFSCPCADDPGCTLFSDFSPKESCSAREVDPLASHDHRYWRPITMMNATPRTRDLARRNLTPNLHLTPICQYMLKSIMLNLKGTRRINYIISQTL